ncbi:ubiquitin-conjugating enzyme/RWD-like protein [Mycena galopus ATCC 62051]|nr:ubiquitin-conjugating enzyme/RWD-like protein [Mycena galopus ATCC 62051]
MHLDASTSASRKRARPDSSEDTQECERTSSIIRRSIAQLSTMPEIPAASLPPLLNTLTDALDSALSVESGNASAALVQSSSMEEDWDWELTAEQIKRLSEEELMIWKDLLPCRHSLRVSRIKLHPLKWKMPIVDLRQWQAHIPGLKNTPWEGGVYSLDVIFYPASPEFIPKLRFFRPLFHPNVYSSGTWGYLMALPEVTFRSQNSEVWVKTKHDDPERFANLLRSIQRVIHNPNLDDPHSSDPYMLAKNDPEGYLEKIRAQAVLWTPDPCTGLSGRPILKSGV